MTQDYHQTAKLKCKLSDAFTPDFFYGFLGIIIYMGLVRRPSIRDYWTNNELGDYFVKNSGISAQHFQAIQSSLHFTTKEEDIEIKKAVKEGTFQDKLKKKNLYGFAAYTSSCKALCAPSWELSVDERMVKSKTKFFSGRQYMKDKPTKWGFKVWVLADSRTGYTYDFDVYCGRTSKTHPDKGLASAVIKNLLQAYYDCGHVIYVDNFYTSQELFQYLFDKKTLAVGTVRENRKGYPKTALDKLTEKSSRQDARWFRRNNVVYFQWKDTRVVNMASTCHSENDIGEMTRKIQDPTTNKWTVAQLKGPACVIDYNSFMGGVDLSDQLIKPYSVTRKTNKWYKMLFYHCVDIAVTNSYIYNI